MAANSIATKISHVPPEEVRAKVLNRVYQYILSLPDPREQKTESAADDLSRKAEGDSVDEVPS
jgi:hypothetical protein